MSDLTDAEDAALGKVLRKVPKFMRDTNDAHAALMRVFYAGLAAGRGRAVEECAVLCEDTTALWPIYNEQREEMAKELANAIRALKDAAPGTPAKT